MNERAEPPDFSRFFVKVPRTAIETLCSSPTAFTVYGVLLSRARYRVGVEVRQRGVIGLNVGECVIGRGELARRLATTERAIITAISTLVETGLISISKTNNQGSTVSLCGYAETYDPATVERSAERSASDQHRSRKRSAERSQSEKSEIEKNEKKKESAPGGARSLSRVRVRPNGRHEPDPEADYEDSAGIPTPQERAP